MLGGEPGIGKTRLAAELLARARAGGARPRALRGRRPRGARRRSGCGPSCSPASRAQLEPPPADATWPEELAPARARAAAPARPRRAPPADVPPELARARLFEAAVELVEHATADRPLVLLFDDVHLADAPSLELVAYVARRIARAARSCSS